MLQAKRALVLALLTFSVMHAAAIDASIAWAADDEDEGKKRFVRGQELYVAGKFLEAAKEFEAGYAAAPRSAFLLNIGHSYRRAGELAKAKSNYELLLEVEPKFAKRDEIEGYLKEINAGLAAAAVKPEPEPAPTPPSAPNPVPPPTAGTTEFEYQRPDVLVLREEDIPKDKKDDEGSVFTSAWFWIIVVGVAAAGGILAATTLGKEQTCPGTVCLKESP